MFKLILVFVVVWIAVLYGTTNVYRLKGRVKNVAKEIAIAGGVTAITFGILAFIVYLF